MKRIAIIGTQGIPAHYGGFETLAENLVKKKHDEQIVYTVFCSSRDIETDMKELHGAKLKYIPLHSNGMQSILYDGISMLMSLRGYDSLLVLGVSGCVFAPFLKILTKAKVVINIDGLEYRRLKWGRVARWFLRLSEKIAVKYADVVIADNKGISDYVRNVYNKSAKLIAYGGDHVLVDMNMDQQKEVLKRYGLESEQYAISICRIEPENNVDMVLDVFAMLNEKIAIVGNFQHNDYSRALKDKYKDCPNIHIIDACYDLNTLFALRNNAGYYIHGHSAGGTNPSLVEAMHFGKPIVTYGVNYNRYTTNGLAEYFCNADELKELIMGQRMMSGDDLKRYAESNYRWDQITQQYETVLSE